MLLHKGRSQTFVHTKELGRWTCAERSDWSDWFDCHAQLLQIVQVWAAVAAVVEVAEDLVAWIGKVLYGSAPLKSYLDVRPKRFLRSVKPTPRPTIRAAAATPTLRLIAHLSASDNPDDEWATKEAEEWLLYALWAPAQAGPSQEGGMPAPAGPDTHQQSLEVAKRGLTTL